MKKSLIALAAVGAFAGSAMAQSSLTVYGVMDLGVIKQNNAEINTAAQAASVGLTAADVTGPALGGLGVTTKNLAVGQATRSRLGFKGVEDLGSGLKAEFDLEHRLLPDTGAINSSGGNNFWDKSIVALVTPYGKIALGRDYTPVFYPQLILDPWFNQGIAEMGASTYAWAGYIGATRSARMNNALFYTLKYEGLTAMLGVSMKEDGLLAGNVANAGAKNRVGLAVSYAAGPLYAAFGYEQSEQTAGADENVMTIGGSYDFGVVKPRVMFTRYDKANKTTPQSIMLALTAPMGQGFLKAGYQQLDFDTVIDTKSSKMSLGYEYTLSKRTALYTDVTNGKVKNYVDASTGAKGNGNSITGFDLGIRHSF